MKKVLFVFVFVCNCKCNKIFIYNVINGINKPIYY